MGAQLMLDLTPYINTSAACVPETFSLERTYMVFKALGLRHLVVVDSHNHVKGIVTRKVRSLCQGQRLPILTVAMLLFRLYTSCTLSAVSLLKCC